MNVYPVLLGAVGGVNASSYVQPLDELSTSINVLLLYQRRFISFASQLACRFDVPEYVSSGAYLQSADDALGAISGSAKLGAEIKIEKIAKQIVPICFGLSNGLHVCVCVCVGFCGFQPIGLFFCSFLRLLFLMFLDEQ